MSVCLYVCMSVCMYVCMYSSFCLSVRPSVRLTACLSMYPSIHVPVYCCLKNGALNLIPSVEVSSVRTMPSTISCSILHAHMHHSYSIRAETLRRSCGGRPSRACSRYRSLGLARSPRNQRSELSELPYHRFQVSLF